MRNRNEEIEKILKSILFCSSMAILLDVMMPNQAIAKPVYYGSMPEQVRVKHGGSTIFRFPKAVQTITGAGRLTIKPANDADPSYTTLAVTPRFTNGLNEVAFFLADGSVVKTKILVSPNDPAADSFYEFRPKDSLDSDQSDSNAPKISEVELLKAMVRDDDVAGYKVSRFSSDVPSKLSSASVELIRIYKGNPFNGYVYRVTNTSWKKIVEVDVRHLSVGEPNLAILAQSDEDRLFPKGKGAHQTLVRIVAKNTSSSRDVIFAMEAQEPEAAASQKKGD
ncbi:MAG: hypothetical protein AB7O96_03660 [Pseudobdellovibrionaceae bacterium]